MTRLQIRTTCLPRLCVCVCLSKCMRVCAQTCLPSAMLQGSSRTWEAGNVVETDRQCCCCRICCPWVYTHSCREEDGVNHFYLLWIWNAVCGFGFWKLTFSSAALPLVLFLISGHEDKVIKDSTTAVETGAKATLNLCQFNPQLPLFLALHQTWLQGFAPIWLQEYRWSLARSWHCSSAQMCWMGRKLGLYPGQPSTTNCESHFFIDQINNPDTLVKANGLNRLNHVQFWYIFIRIKGHLTN